jgi:alpha-L-rhamnosidase
VDILPEKMAVRASERLVDLIHTNQDHLGTGFLGTPYLCIVLTKYGYTDLAYTLLRQTTQPSWLYPVKMGATTIWEKWTALMPDSSINVSSFNHYADGAIGNWLYRDVAGINPGKPGYQKIIIHPHIGGGLIEANASYLSDYGLIRSAWETISDQLDLRIEIPTNTRAEVWIPARDVGEIRERGRLLATISGVNLLPAQKDCIVVELGSGSYHFTISR